MDKNLNVKSKNLEFLENNMGEYLGCRVMNRFFLLKWTDLLNKEQIPTNLKKVYNLTTLNLKSFS